jgi:hypothetical protein
VTRRAAPAAAAAALAACGCGGGHQAPLDRGAARVAAAWVRAFYVDRDCAAARRYADPATGPLASCLIIRKESRNDWRVVPRSGAIVRRCAAGGPTAGCVRFTLAGRTVGPSSYVWLRGRLGVGLERRRGRWKVTSHTYAGGSCAGPASECRTQAAAWRRGVRRGAEAVPLLRG